MSGPGSYVDALDGSLDGRGLRVAVLCTRFHGDIAERLLGRCVTTLEAHGVGDEAVDIERVPGAWELPQVAARIASLDRHDVIIAIGCVIRGDTPHFDYVAGEATRGLGEVARDYDRPVIFGVLTTDTEEQAWERAREDGQDKGRELALAALEMGLLYRRLA